MQSTPLPPPELKNAIAPLAAQAAPRAGDATVPLAPGTGPPATFAELLTSLDHTTDDGGDLPAGGNELPLAVPLPPPSPAQLSPAPGASAAGANPFPPAAASAPLPPVAIAASPSDAIERPPADAIAQPSDTPRPIAPRERSPDVVDPSAHGGARAATAAAAPSDPPPTFAPATVTAPSRADTAGPASAANGEQAAVEQAGRRPRSAEPVPRAQALHASSVERRLAAAPSEAVPAESPVEPGPAPARAADASPFPATTPTSPRAAAGDRSVVGAASAGAPADATPVDGVTADAATDAARVDARADGAAPPPAPQPTAQQPPAAGLDDRAPIGRFAGGTHEAVADGIRWMIDHRVGEARLTLNPPELGTVDVKISVVDDRTYVQIVASSPHARDDLEQSLPRLRELLAQGGLDLAGATVSGGRDERGPSARPEPSPHVEPPVPRPRAALAALARRPAASSIDLYA